MIGEPCRAATGSGEWLVKRRPLTLDEARRGCLPDETTDEEWRALHAATAGAPDEAPVPAAAMDDMVWGSWSSTVGRVLAALAEHAFRRGRLSPNVAWQSDDKVARAISDAAEVIRRATAELADVDEAKVRVAALERAAAEVRRLTHALYALGIERGGASGDDWTWRHANGQAVPAAGPIEAALALAGSYQLAHDTVMVAAAKMPRTVPPSQPKDSDVWLFDRAVGTYEAATIAAMECARQAGEVERE